MDTNPLYILSIIIMLAIAIFSVVLHIMNTQTISDSLLYKLNCAAIFFDIVGLLVFCGVFYCLNNNNKNGLTTGGSYKHYSLNSTPTPQNQQQQQLPQQPSSHLDSHLNGYGPPTSFRHRTRENGDVNYIE